MEVVSKLGNLIPNNKEAMVTKFNKKLGEGVKSGEVILEVEAEKGNMPIRSTVEGIIKRIKVEVGQSVTSETELVIIEKKEAVNKTESFNYFNTLLKPLKEEIECDVAIIGGGPGGYVAAIRAAQKGAKVVLVEKQKLGGTCLNWGCIPTKALVRSAKLYDEMKNGEEFGCFAENIHLDLKKVMERKNNVVNQLVQGVQYLMEKNKVRVIFGTGEIIDKNTVLSKSNSAQITIKTKNIIIATGAQTSKLPIKGMELDNVITSEEALDLKELPKKIVIVGGGVIGMEFAYIFANFGVEVSIVEYFNECLISCDEDICEANHENAKEKGIKLYTGAKVEEIIKTEEGNCMVVFEKDKEKRYIAADKVLIAVGRTPYCDGIGIENLGIEKNPGGKGIKVNANMQTSIPNIYAIGDVTNIIQLAHVASHQGMVAVENIMGRETVMEYDAVPSAIFTDPEIAVVGICEKLAKSKGIEIETSKFPFMANGKALTYGETKGFVKLIKEKNTGRVIGGTIVGLHATDLIGEITLAIKNKLTAEQIVETIHAHPTTGEVIHEAALALEGGAIHFA